MKQLNTLTIEGYLAEDPKFRDIGEGKQFAAFRIANNQDYKDSNGEYVDQTFYLNVVVKSQPNVTAIKEKLSKGAHVLVHGRIENRSYQPQGESEKRWITEVVVNPYGGEIHFLDLRKRTSDNA